MKNYANSIAYKEYLEQYNYIFEKAYYMGQENHALTDNVKVVIENYNHSYDITHNYGKSISCQRIKLLDKTGNELFTTRFAFGKLFYQYILPSNSSEYFIAGNDLMEFSIYNITKSEEYKFVSECRIDEESDEDCDNEFWYITEWIYNPENNLVAINGQDMYSISFFISYSFAKIIKNYDYCFQVLRLTRRIWHASSLS
ncbi:hypothetical protein [Sphingobacterium tabacisoli]|uniref:Uncharacterized protein n=1 Tax=Sphingobacterium tabacisoli TaxID=2044855 RepID=A0ABW5L5Q2_9SPHI|nr:hypothetical protein [Sphingobacterium tabacisoli]